MNFIKMSFILFFLLLFSRENYAADFSLSNSVFVLVSEIKPDYFDWDCKNVASVIQRLRYSHSNSLHSEVTRRSMKSEPVRAEVSILLGNWLAKYSDSGIQGIVHLKGAQTSTDVFIHQHDNHFRVLHVSQPLIEKFVSNTYRRRGALKE